MMKQIHTAFDEESCTLKIREKLFDSLWYIEHKEGFFKLWFRNNPSEEYIYECGFAEFQDAYQVAIDWTNERNL